MKKTAEIRFSGFRLFVFMLALCVAACTHINDEDEEKDNKDTTADKIGWDDDIVSVPVDNGWITVAEAAEAPVGDFVNVRGYILGTALRSMHNLSMAEPFNSRTSLILADQIFRGGDTPDEYDPFYEDYLLPVRLSDAVSLQRDLNLVDNPGNWHRLVYIYGRKTVYMGVPGIDTILQYEFAD